MKVIRNNRISKDELLVDETVFSLANGFIGIRGNFCEGYGTDFEYNQTYINGFYNLYDYFYEENLTGFPQVGEKFVNVFDGTTIEFYINGKALNLTNAKVIDLNREYDLEKGYSVRKITYELDGYEFTLIERRMVNHSVKDIITIDVTLKSDYKGVVEVRSYLVKSTKKHRVNDPRLHTDKVPHLEILNVDLDESSIQAKTTWSNLHLCSSMVHNLDFELERIEEGIVGTKKIQFNKKLNITKHIIHTTDLYDDEYVNLNKELNKNFSFESPKGLFKTEEEYSTLFWTNSKVKLNDNPYYESLLNYNMFQLNRQGGEHEKHNIAAKGLSGEGYEGHYFWDTEIYMIPYFILTNPKKAKNLLMYRYNKLEKSRNEAKLLGYEKGIKIPWRTISGNETSPYYPAGSAQFHINSDVAYTIIKYVQATGDIEFLKDYGFELMVETARFLVEATNYSSGKYHLNAVTGPDEYSTVVDDNCYTNMMLQYHLGKLIEYKDKYKGELENISRKLNLLEEELNHFKDVMQNLNIPFSEELQVFKQDENFFDKKKLDLSSIPKDKFPLLLNYHPLYLYKHQVLKQADTLLGLVLLDYDNEEVLRNTFNYYEEITTHDSSLSKCVYSISAYQLGNDSMASDYFKQVIETDYENTHGNTAHGLHVANLGGSYLGFVYGICGIRIHEDYLTISPRKNSISSDYEFTVQYRGEVVTIKVDSKLRIKTTGTITLNIYGNLITLDDSYECDLNN